MRTFALVMAIVLVALSLFVFLTFGKRILRTVTRIFREKHRSHESRPETA